MEVKIGTPATITCTITNIASPNGVRVTWKDGEQTVTDNVDTSSVSSKQQVSTLTVQSPQTDKVYTSIISSSEYSESEPFSQQVNLNVFGKYLEMIFQSYLRLTCQLPPLKEIIYVKLNIECHIS